MKKFTFMLFVLLPLQLLAFDKFDNSVCESSSSDQKRIDCFREFGFSETCKNTSSANELDCYRKAAIVLLSEQKQQKKDALLPEEKEEQLKQQKEAEHQLMLEQKVRDFRLYQAIKEDIESKQQRRRSSEIEPNNTTPSLGLSCELDSFTRGVERNTDGCNLELSSYGSPQPGGECVSLIASAELLSDYLSGEVSNCSSSQKDRARIATNAAISTLRRTQSR